MGKDAHYLITLFSSGAADEDAAGPGRTTKRQRTARAALGFAPVAEAPARAVLVEGPLTAAQLTVVNAAIADILRDVTGEVPVSELKVSPRC